MSLMMEVVTKIFFSETQNHQLTSFCVTLSLQIPLYCNKQTQKCIWRTDFDVGVLIRWDLTKTEGRDIAPHREGLGHASPRVTDIQKIPWKWQQSAWTHKAPIKTCTCKQKNVHLFTEDEWFCHHLLMLFQTCMTCFLPQTQNNF